jgi:GNAT superfamily N-acetyltransferase
MLTYRGSETGMQIQKISPEDLKKYSTIPISFEVSSVFKVYPINHGRGGLQLIEENCSPYTKDYDMYEDAHPTNWARRFDLAKWRLFVFAEDEKYIGGAAVVFDMPETEREAATLWDLRVHPDFRNRGIGAKLLNEVITEIKERGCFRLTVETQNINVPACRFYARKGFTLGSIDVHGYSDSPVSDEAKLLWYMDFTFDSSR